MKNNPGCFYFLASPSPAPSTPSYSLQKPKIISCVSTRLWRCVPKNYLNSLNMALHAVCTTLFYEPPFSTLQLCETIVRGLYVVREKIYCYCDSVINAVSCLTQSMHIKHQIFSSKQRHSFDFHNYRRNETL